MSTSSQWQLEREATRSFLDLQEQAERSRDLYELAKMQLPEPLKRFLGLGVIETKAKGLGPSIPPPPYPRPPVAGDDWIWVSLKDALPITAMAAALRDQAMPLRARDVVAKVLELLPHVAPGSVANLFSRLEGNVLRREEGGWVLINRDTAPVLHDGRLWGPVGAFQKIEVATYRRDVIAYLLTQFSSGLQIVQIVEQMGKMPWLRGPCNKDLVKDDMQALLAAGIARHRGNSRKWEIAPPREDAAESVRMLNFMR